MKYFKGVKSIEELRRQYKELAMRYHPDRGGKVEDMQGVNAEYDMLRERLKDIHERKDGSTYRKAPEAGAEVPDNFKEIINKIIRLHCVIEICGSWIWCFNAYDCKDTLKGLGFFWCSRKRAWAWCEDAGAKHKHHFSMDQIRRMHGSLKVETLDPAADMLEA